MTGNIWDDFFNLGDDNFDRMVDRRAHCGTQAIRYFSPETGRYKRGKYRCDLSRNAFCPECFARRVNQFRDRVQRAVLDAWHDGERKLRITNPMSKGEASRFVRGLPKSSYLRLPTDDGDVILVDDDGDGGARLDYQLAADLNWAHLARTPEGRNVSGDLGKLKEDNSLEDGVIEVEIKSIIIHDDTSPEQEETALLQAIEETADLNPTTPEEVQQAVRQRAEAFIKALKQAGGSILGSRVIKMRCQTSRISWSAYTKRMASEDLGVDEWAEVVKSQA